MLPRRRRQTGDSAELATGSVARHSDAPSAGAKCGKRYGDIRMFRHAGGRGFHGRARHTHIPSWSATNASVQAYFPHITDGHPARVMR